MSAPGGKRRVLVVGDVMTDVIVVPEGALVRGSDRRARITQLPGGSGANQAIWLGSLGADVRFVARVAAAEKAALETRFRGCGVDPILTGDATLPSGVLVTIVDPDGERSFLTDRGANLALSDSDLPLGLLDDTEFLVVSGYTFFVDGPRQAVLRLYAEARRRGVKIIVDPASVGFLLETGIAHFFEWTTGGAVIFANYDEAFALSGVPDIEEQTRLLGAYYDRVVIKRGALGASIGDAKGIRFQAAAAKVEVLDTTGGGDAFVAGFLAAELRGESEEACLAAGVEAGTSVVQQLGGQPRC